MTEMKNENAPPVAECAAPAAKRAVFRPRMDVREDEHGLSVELDVPGIAREDLSIDFERGVMTVTGRRRPQEPEGESGAARTLVREMRGGDYRRTFRVGESIDPEGVSAEHANGVLKLRLPKSAAARARRIDIGQG